VFFAWAVDDNWQRLGVALVMVTAGCGITFRYIPWGFRLWNNRVLPFWLMGTYILAGFGLYAIGKTVSRAFNLARENSDVGQHRHSIAVVAGILATWAAIGVPLGILPKFLPSLKFTRETTTLTKADGSTEQKRSGPWLVGVRQVGDSSDFGASEASGWPQYNYQGYENRGGNWTDYKNIMDTMKKVGAENGCGRANWEYESKQDRWGTPMALMLLPYWTDSCIQSMEGLYFESAPTVPFHWMNSSLLSKAPSNPQRDLPYSGLDVAKGVKKLQEFGVRYYMAFSVKAIEQADKNPDLKLITTTTYQRACDDAENQAGTCPKKWNIYLVKSADLVSELPARPVVVQGIGQSQQTGWLDQAAAIYKDPRRFPAPFVAEGPNKPPKEWERINVSESRSRENQEFGATYSFNAPKEVQKLEKVNITNIKAASLGKGEGRPGDLSFTVDKVGVPVVVKISYFPNFKLRGAKGPYRMANNMMVVIPTQKNVSMSYRWNLDDFIGFAGGLLGIGLCVLMWQLDRRSRQTAKAAHLEAWRNGRRNAPTDAELFTPESNSQGY
jgi:hypothetical protein